MSDSDDITFTNQELRDIHWGLYVAIQNGRDALNDRSADAISDLLTKIGVYNETANAQMTTFTVIEEAADDPESNRTWTGVSAAWIRDGWPQFASLFPDNCENSLVFVAELNRWTIKPEYD